MYIILCNLKEVTEEEKISDIVIKTNQLGVGRWWGELGFRDYPVF
jgi:hypothetical protein